MKRFLMFTAICLSCLWLGGLSLAPPPEIGMADASACTIVGTDIIFYCDRHHEGAILIDDADLSAAFHEHSMQVAYHCPPGTQTNDIIGTDISF